MKIATRDSTGLCHAPGEQRIARQAEKSFGLREDRARRDFPPERFPPHVADTLPHAVVKPRAPRSFRSRRKPNSRTMGRAAVRCASRPAHRASATVAQPGWVVPARLGPICSGRLGGFQSPSTPYARRSGASPWTKAQQFSRIRTQTPRPRNLRRSDRTAHRSPLRPPRSFLLQALRSCVHRLPHEGRGDGRSLQGFRQRDDQEAHGLDGHGAFRHRPTVGIYQYAVNYKENEKMSHRY